MAIDFFPITPRFFSDERLYRLDADYKIVYAYACFGLQSSAAGKVGIHRVGRGEIASGANVDMAKTEKIIDFFDENLPDLMQYDKDKHVIFLPSKLKYLIRYGYITLGSSLIKAVHEDFKKYGSKAPQFWSDLTMLYEEEIKGSFAMISRKDKNFPYYAETIANLFEDPSPNIAKFSSKKLKENEKKI